MTSTLLAAPSACNAQDAAAEDWLMGGIDVSPIQPKASAIDAELSLMGSGDSDSDSEHEHANRHARAFA
jgi:hypothetical protein